MSLFYDVVKQKYNKITKKLKDILITDNYNVQNSINSNNDKVLDIYIDTKKILTCNYDILGVYDVNCGIFSWSTTLKLVDRELLTKVKHIQKYNKELEKLIITRKYSDIEFMETILYYISNNMFYIESDNIEQLLEFSCFITDSIGYLIQKEKNKYIYYLITNIVNY